MALKLLDSCFFVYTIVSTMSSYISTVIKTGNSYALRVPKEYIKHAELQLGDKAEILLPVKHKSPNRERILKIIEKLQSMHALSEIKDPVAWQRAVRKDRILPGRQ